MVDDGNMGRHRWMSKREAVFRLLEISKNRDLDLDDVIAIQTAVRSLCKRIFDSERNFKRRRERGVAVVDPADGRRDGGGRRGTASGRQQGNDRQLTGKRSNVMKRIVIGDNGHTVRLRGEAGKAVVVVRKTAPANVGETVRVAWKDEANVVDGGEYVVSFVGPEPHGTRETWRHVELVKRQKDTADE